MKLALIALLLASPAAATVTVKSNMTVPKTSGTTLTGTSKTSSATYMYQSSATVSNATIRGVIVNTAYRVIDTPSSTTLKSSAIDGVIGTNLYRGLIRVRNVDGLKITNVTGLYKLKPATDITYLPAGLQVEGNATNVSVENANFNNFQLIMGASEYWNGDGVNWDSRGTGASLRNINAVNNTDAGLDIKAPNVILDNIYASGNKRDIRLWDGCQCGSISLGQPIKRGGSSSGAGIWLHSGANRATYTIQKLTVRFTNSSYPVIILDNDVDLTIVDCDILVPPGTEFIHRDTSGSRVTLGTTCHA